MSPGSSWSSDNEFELTNLTIHRRKLYKFFKKNYLQKLEIQYANENEEKADLNSSKYFDTF